MAPPSGSPPTSICDVLNAFHVYAETASTSTGAEHRIHHHHRPGIRFVDSTHYCAMAPVLTTGAASGGEPITYPSTAPENRELANAISGGGQGQARQPPAIRQCLIYDSSAPNARLIGIEFMIPRSMYMALPAYEKRLWHSHGFEVKSGMLVRPPPKSAGAAGAAEAEQADAGAWERQRETNRFEEEELEAMTELVGLYGKTWHFWQTDRGDPLPLGMPQLMGSFTNDNQTYLPPAELDTEQEGVGGGVGGSSTAAPSQEAGKTGKTRMETFREIWEARDRRLGVDSAAKRERRRGLPDVEIEGAADWWWQGEFQGA